MAFRTLLFGTTVVHLFHSSTMGCKGTDEGAHNTVEKSRSMMIAYANSSLVTLCDNRVQLVR